MGFIGLVAGAVLELERDVGGAVLFKGLGCVADGSAFPAAVLVAAGGELLVASRVEGRLVVVEVVAGHDNGGEWG